MCAVAEESETSFEGREGGSSELFESAFHWRFFKIQAADDSPMHGNNQHQQVLAEPVGALQLCLFKPKASIFVLGEEGFDAPSQTVIEDSRSSRRCVCGDKPRLIVPLSHYPKPAPLHSPYVTRVYITIIIDAFDFLPSQPASLNLSLVQSGRCLYANDGTSLVIAYSLCQA